jgi:hypothetical protein
MPTKISGRHRKKQNKTEQNEEEFLPEALKKIHLRHIRFSNRCVHRTFKSSLTFGPALDTLGHFIQNIGCFMYPATLLRYRTIFFLEREPKTGVRASYA